MGSFLFSTFAGLRGAVSLILAQQLVLDQSQYPHEARVIAEVRTRGYSCVWTLPKRRVGPARLLGGPGIDRCSKVAP